MTRQLKRLCWRCIGLATFRDIHDDLTCRLGYCRGCGRYGFVATRIDLKEEA